MQEASSRVQSTFGSNNNIQLHLNLIQGVRICGSFFTELTVSCIYQFRRKGQCFIALYKLKIPMATSFLSQKSAKVL